MAIYFGNMQFPSLWFSSTDHDQENALFMLFKINIVNEQ